MELPLLLIVVGIVLAVLVNPVIIGIVVIVIGLVLLLLPRIRGSSARV